MANRLLTAAEMGRVDRWTTERVGIPEIVLMENAGVGIAGIVMEFLKPRGGRVVVACGPGNNGGDGLVVLRHLILAGKSASAILLKSEMVGAAGINLEVARRLNFDLQTWPKGRDLLADLTKGDIVVDAVFGTGISRPPEGDALELLKAISMAADRGATVISADVPSGLSDHGPLEGCVRATATAAIAYEKTSLATGEGMDFAGKVFRVNISIPPMAEAALAGEKSAVRLTAEDGPTLIPVRRVGFHKGEAGHVAVLMGGEEKTGAGILACLGALSCGAGLVTALGRFEGVTQIRQAHPALMTKFLVGTGAYSAETDGKEVLQAMASMDALVVGPGLQRGPQTEDFLLTLLASMEDKTIVLDADALNAVAASPRLLETLAKSPNRLILTPHPKEMSRLVRRTVSEVQASRIQIARQFAEEHGVWVVLKGSGSVVSHPNGEVAVIGTGCSGMATPGAGDVLSGAIAAMILQCDSTWNGVRAATLAHGFAGELASENKGNLALNALDLVDGMSLVWRRWKR